jgi:hypothetical protein
MRRHVNFARVRKTRPKRPRSRRRDSPSNERSSPLARRIRCECPLQPIPSLEDAVGAHDSLVHARDCEQQWGSAAEFDSDGEELD